MDSGSLFFKVDGKDLGVAIENDKDLKEGQYYFTVMLFDSDSEFTIINPDQANAPVSDM